MVSGELDAIEVGDTLEGYFSYDPAATSDTNSWDVWGTYPFDADSSSFSLKIYDTSADGQMLFDLESYLSEIITENNWTYPNYPVVDAFTSHAIHAKDLQQVDYGCVLGVLTLEPSDSCNNRVDPK